MRLLVLSLGVIPYLALVAADCWMHEKSRRVPRREQYLHLGIGLGIGSFVVLAFLGRIEAALAALLCGLAFMAVDELGYHRSLARRERRLHAYAALALLLFLGVFLWTESTG